MKVCPALALLLAACSAARIAQEELERGIEDFVTWHRAHALPQYAAIADDAARRFARGLSREDLVWGYDAAMAQARESARAAAERIAPLLDRLTPAQIAYLERELAEDNRRFAQRYLRGDGPERRRRRLERNVERLEDWVGGLSNAQVERVALYAERAPLLEELRGRDRALHRWARDFRVLSQPR